MATFLLWEQLTCHNGVHRSTKSNLFVSWPFSRRFQPCPGSTMAPALRLLHRYHLTLSHYLFSLCGFISILWGQQGRNSTHLLSILSAKRKGRRVSSHLVQWTRTESHWSDCVHLCASHFHQGNELWLPRLGPLAHPGSWRRGWSALPWAPRWGGGGMLR